MKNDKGKNLAIIIGVLFFVIGVLVGMYVGTKYVSNEKNNIKEDFANKDDSSNVEYSEGEVIDYLDDQIRFLDGETSLKSLDNSDKMNIAFNLYQSIYSKFIPGYVNNGFLLKDLKEAFENSIYSNLDIEYGDIYFGTEKFYELRNNKYVYVGSGHGSFVVYPVFNKVVDFKVEGEKYTIKYHYVFSAGSEGPKDYRLFYTYDDAKNGYSQGKSFYEFKLDDYVIDDESYYINDEKMKNDVDNYINKNYDNIKDKLDTYVYVLEKDDNSLKLVDFYLE